MKRIFTLLLALVMVLSLAAPARRKKKTDNVVGKKPAAKTTKSEK